ncbi:guanine nucleotide exchange protein SMCR8-like [Branchiostoma lanceolatum]|uniref:guanine nucleotide exchange protein SMCR8-like n=1 Tax=Branchiostoma lanceolatum TaxID=7740 RepID=UPI003455B823
MFHVGYSEMVAYGVNTDEDYYEDGSFKSRLPPELAFRPENPWHADAKVTEDFVLIAEFSEQEGPKPLETIPEHGGGRFDKNNFAVRIMSADYQTHGSAGGFCLVEDTHVVMMDNKEGACAYVHHFTLFDLQARGFVRPFCMSYVTTDRSKIMTNLEEMMSEFKKVSSVFKYGNRLMFVQELEHRLADLQYTRDKYEQWQKQKDSGKLSSVDLEEAALLETISPVTLDRVTQETTDILRTVRPSLNNPRLERHFRRLQDRSQAQAVRQDASSEDGCHSNSTTSHCSEEDGGKLMSENGVPYVPKVIRPDSSKQFDQELRRLDQLCGQGEREGLNRLRQIQKFFSRDSMAVSMEKKESKLIDPPPGLLTFGRCVAMNFLHNVDLQCAGGCWPLGQTGRTELQHPARNLFRRWMSSESLSSLYTTDSFQSGLESRGATHSLDPTFLPASSYKSIDSVYYDYEEDDELNYDSDSLEILSSSETSGTTHFLEETTLTLRPSTMVNIEESSPFHGLLSTAIGRRDTPTQDTYHSLKDSASFSEDLLSNNSIDILEDTEMFPKDIRILRRRSKSEGNDSVDTIHGESPSLIEEDNKTSESLSLKQEIHVLKESPKESRTDCLEGATEQQDNQSIQSQSQDEQVDIPSGTEKRNCTGEEEKALTENLEEILKEQSEDKQSETDRRNCTGEMEEDMCNNVSNLSCDEKEEAMLSGDRFEPSGNSEYASAKSSVVEEFNTPAQNTPCSSISSTRSDVQQGAACRPVPHDLTLDPGSFVGGVASSVNSDYSVPDSPTDNRLETPPKHKRRKNGAVAVTSMGSTGSESAGGSWPSSGEAGTVESRHIRMSVCSHGDHICNFGPQLPGYGVVRFMKQYVFAAHVIYALLTGRPLVVMGLPRQEREVRGLVTTLSLFVPGFSNRYHTVIPWHTAPLCLTDICNTKLIGLAKVKPAERMIPSSVKRYVSVFDCDKKTLTTPQYQGTYINAIVSRKKDFKVDEPYIGYIHSMLLELASKAFLYYHSYCLNSPNVENMQSHDGEKLKKKTAAGFLGKLGVQDGDAKVVEYLAEIIKQQQVDDLLLRHDRQARSRDSELPPPPIRTEYRACSQYRV